MQCKCLGGKLFQLRYVWKCILLPFLKDTFPRYRNLFSWHVFPPVFWRWLLVYIISDQQFAIFLFSVGSAFLSSLLLVSRFSLYLCFIENFDYDVPLCSFLNASCLVLNVLNLCIYSFQQIRKKYAFIYSNISMSPFLIQGC